ncbi:hypothetical protein [Alicyclobacillus dauci]|uniref:DUF3973 domain-containing protein n=1 Tax=Alicyclobacillus dauci TaxID=1475485 RepID=A0ABY6Z7S1_9BACL|nr:hypothetical protein [Alicyclobacillus dauci]WAH38294.1 hypothetical protein NZD86_07370 [Alicyclobacillus dauci]
MTVMYCLHCGIIHDVDHSDNVFRTGFRRLPDGQDIPLGVCNQDAAINASPVTEIGQAEHLAAG